MAILALAVAGSVAGAGGAALSDPDRDAITALAREYVAAWRANDPDRVMATLTGDAVLIPHHGATPVAGSAAIRAFWWPPGAAATVTGFGMTVAEVGGSGDVGFARGRFELEFEYDGKVSRNEGNYLLLTRRGDDGRWRITHRIWNDPLPGHD